MTIVQRMANKPVGGRLRFFVGNWEKITGDPWVRETVTGARVEFHCTPVQGRSPGEVHLSVQQSVALTEEVRKLQEKQAITPASAEGGFTSTVFLVPKADGSWRPVINLQALNKHVITRHFKMESIRTARGLIHQGEWLLKLDLKDAYLNVPVCQEHQEYLKFQWQGQTWKFQALPFGSKQCPAHVYQTHEADSGLIEEVGTQDRHVPRRYADSGKDTRGGTSAPGDNCKDPGSIGLRDQPGQEHHNADPETGIPGICSRFSQDDHLPSWTQVTLSPVGEEEIASSEEGSQLPVPSGSHHRDEDGATMVGGGGMPPQWETLENQPVGCVYRIGCVQDGLGSILSRQVCRRTMDCRREGAQYQLPRITGGLLSLEVLCEDQRGVGPVTTRQHYGDCIRQQDGRHSLQAVVRPSSGDWEVVLGQENTGPCRTSAWSREHQSGLGVQTRGGIGGLDAGLPSLRAIEPITWPIHSGPVCLQDECTASPVLQLETRPRSLVSGRIHSFMGNPIPIYVSSIHSDLSVSEQNEVRAILRTSDCTSVAQSSLVPTAPETSTGLPNSVTTNGGHSNRPGRIQPPNGNGGSPSASRLAHLRRSYNAEGFSDRVIEILRKSWRSSTEAAYSSAWKQWDCWCLERGSDPISAPINTILEFLLHQYEAGKKYNEVSNIHDARRGGWR